MSRTYPYFDAPLDTRYEAEASRLLGQDHWRVLQPFRLMLSERQWVAVPAGILTDGGTIPRIAQSFVSPWGKLGQAYVMHDQLCEYLSITVDGAPVSISRTRGDSLLYVALDVLGATQQEIAVVAGAVELYRNVSQVNLPSNRAMKRSLESKWM
ncbi:DUF1353 domain-containing protein [Pseudomonas sp. 6D_7.1_Bac1]|uniref:DUF1353 domain-containing protein n=1 Tax=Pseudomonas sp. 6D_7.1_Bac1 TaxID=2971615 RepID=UPI0021CA910C|nr:DUF1353 domain-containing protein [Pseudomonas sp. 6D_7.1_Bac1]MCU1750256.1 DUF1353 domain-containing protein [Pseudomonas sp. 6D_7.1_Bac1]